MTRAFKARGDNSAPETVFRIEIPDLKNLSINSPQFAKWRRDTESRDRKYVSGMTLNLLRISKRFVTALVSYIPRSSLIYLVNSKDIMRKGLDDAAVIIESMIDEINRVLERR